MDAMAEMRPFLRTIAENPDDDNPRLVFSDWLEENGHQDRAEFIRLQIELANMNPSDDGYAEKTARMYRCGVFTSQGTIPFFDHLPCQNSRIAFRRGFIASVRTGGAQTLDTSGLEFVPLQILRTDRHLIDRFAGVTSLKRLEYNDWHDTPTGLLELFGPDGSFKTLEELQLMYVNKACLEAGVIPQFDLPRLRNFYLRTDAFFDLGTSVASDTDQDESDPYSDNVPWHGLAEYLPKNALPNSKCPLERFIWHSDDDCDLFNDEDWYWRGPTMESLLEHLRTRNLKQIEVVVYYDDHEGGAEGYIAAPYQQNPLELSSSLECVTLGYGGAKLLKGPKSKLKTIRNYGVDGPDLFKLLNQPACSELELLFVEDRHGGWWGPDPKSGPKFTLSNLKTLSLSEEPLEPFSNCHFPNLTSLLRCGYDKAFQEREWPKLLHLEMSFNKLSELKAFAQSDCCPNLTTLAVRPQFHPKPEWSELAFLANCPHMPFLSLIRMYGTHIVKNGQLLPARSDLMWDDHSVFDFPASIFGRF